MSLNPEITGLTEIVDFARFYGVVRTHWGLIRRDENSRLLEPAGCVYTSTMAPSRGANKGSMQYSSEVRVQYRTVLEYCDASGGREKKKQEGCKLIRRSLAFTDWWDLGYTAADSTSMKMLGKRQGSPRAAC